jgi:5-methylcytosine-specific restriction endonuclease McrBC regulatory subunit McrC
MEIPGQISAEIDNANASVLEFLAGEFAIALAAVVDHGLKKSYVFRQANDARPKGRINL